MPDNVVSIIPARKGSKGIPRKNLRKLGEHPLVAHAIRTSRESNLIDHVVLTTDSEEIAQIGQQYNVDQIINRPSNLATDEVPLAPVINHAFNELNRNFNYVLTFQPTAPLVSVNSINEGINLGTDNAADSVIFVTDNTHIYWRKGKNGYEPLVEDRKNRQELSPIYEELGIFLSEGHIIQQESRIGNTPIFHQIEGSEGIDIDTYADWILAESELHRNQILYRLIGNKYSGTGHVYRALTLADHIFHHDIQFVVESTEHLAIEKLEESNYDYEVLNDKQSFIQYVRSKSPDIVVNDVLDTSAEYIKSLKNHTAHVVNIEDLGSGTDHADVVINALYEHSNPKQNHYFGYEYFCLRNEFRYKNPRTKISSVDRIMISFGGIDENNLTAKTLRALSDMQHEVHLDVILGKGYTEKESLDPVTSEYPSNISIEINQDTNSMAEHMKQADLLITSNGRTLYESASLNIPAISIAQNHREQKHPYAHISGGVLFIGQADLVTEENILTAANDYIASKEKRKNMLKSLKRHDITEGVERVKKLLFDKDNEN